MTEQKIREAFDDFIEANKKHSFDLYTVGNYIVFKSGYLALLNKLVPQGEWNIFPNGLDGDWQRAIEATILSKLNSAEPVAWEHSCNVLCLDNVELWIDRCPHCGKPSPLVKRPPAPSAVDAP